MNEKTEAMWSPKEIRNTKIFQFINHVNSTKNLNIQSYKELWKWSVDNISEFWGIFLTFSKIKYYGSYEKVVDENIPMQNIPKWFEGCKLSYAENLLHPDIQKPGIIAENESRIRVVLTHAEIYRETSKLFHQFQRFGLKEGDIIASVLPNDYRAVIAMLACSSLGCVWTSMPTELQAIGIIQKLSGIKPAILLATDSIVYAGNTYNQVPKIREISSTLDYLKAVIIFPSAHDLHLDEDKIMSTDIFSLKFGDSEDQERKICFNVVPFSHPLFILYTSGTTGPSKKLVHSVGGTLIKVVMEHMMNGDLDENDVVFYNTSPGWIMWNWVVTSLYFGGTLLLYDGSAVKPNPYILWDICDQNKATVFGSGAAYYYFMEQNNIQPNNLYKFENLRYFLSTGSFLPESSYHYINNKVKSGLPICSIAGATDIISCFAGHNLTIPVYPGEIQYPNLGMHVQCFNNEGKPVFDEFGEFVCVKAFPSMPVYFMNDEGNAKYKETYFSKYPGVWTHGDYCMLNSQTGGLIISGRSDSTLNVNGVRIGSSEIYNIVQQVPGVVDSLCLCQDMGKGTERMVLFVSHSMKDAEFDNLVSLIKEKILTCLSPRYLPALFLPAPKIPYTITGKKVEILIKKIISKKPYLINHESLKDPSSLDYFIQLQI